MIGDIIVIVVCFGLILIFREVDKQNRSFEKIKKFSDKILSDFAEYFKNQKDLLKNSGVDLDVKQAQAVAAVKRFDDTIAEFEKRSAQLNEKLSIVTDIENRLAVYDSSLNNLFEMTERVEENLERIRQHSNLVNKVSHQLDVHEKQLGKIENDIPNIVSNLEKLNEEKMNVLGSDFSSWVEQRTADLQALANAAVDKNELLLEEIKLVYDESFRAASQKAENFEDEIFENLKSQTIQRSEEFEELLSRNSNDLNDYIAREKEDLENTVNQKIIEAQKLADASHEQFKEKSETAFAQLTDMIEHIDETLVAKQKESEEVLQNFESNIVQLKSTVQSELENLQVQFQSTLDDMANEMQESIDNVVNQKLETAIESQDEQIQASLLEQDTQFREKISGIKEELENKLTKLFEKAENEIARQSDEIVSFEENFARAQEMVKHMDESVLAKQNETKIVVDRLQEQLESNAGALANVLDDKILALENEFDNIVESLRNKIATQTQAIHENLADKCNALQGSLDERIDSIDEVVSSLHDEVLKENHEKSAEFFLGLDEHIKEARKDAEYRLERLNTAGHDIDNLENNFRRLMEIAEQRVNADFEKFKDSANIAQKEFEEHATESFNTVRTGLDAIDSEINSLKNTAYENVSEKLQIFEDDFFADLTTRTDTMSDSLDDWKRAFTGQLTELSANLEKDRLATESKFSEDMKEQLLATQERYREQLSRLEENMKTTEGQYVVRMQEIEKNLHSFIDEQRTEINNAKANAEEHFKTELVNHGEQTVEKLKRFERDISNQLGQLEQSVSATQDETSSSLESLLSDLTSWSERLNTQFQESRDLYNEKFDSLQQSAQEQISQVEQVFSVDLGNFVNSVNEEKSKISMEIDELKEQTQKSLASYESRSEETLEEFRKSYEYMLEDTQKRIRGENSEAEQKVLALKSMVKDVRQESEEMQEKMVLKIQTEANLLKISMDDIDKKLKQFVAQTQLFEKTDEMKNELENQMSDLRTQLVRFENFKQVTDSIEAQFTKIRKLDDETITRMQRLSAEKNRIDALETDFSKLIALSGSMDQKISELKSTNDDLQVLQLEVRTFQETLVEISSRYDRLEKKSPVLDKVMGEIDKAFANLKELEDRLAACAQETVEIPGTVEGLKMDLSNLVSHSKTISEIMDKIQDLETVLSTTTKQVESVEKAREGIVKVESRLVDIIKDAKDQINLYKTVKDGGKKNEPGAPPIAVRENVVQLARQGWRADQIAQNLGLSRGEVELLLDYYASQNK